MKYQKQRLVKKPAGRKSVLPFFLGIIVLGLLVAQVIVSNRLATSGLKITDLENEISDLNQANSLYTEKIASASALTTLRSKAKELGFVKNISPVYFSRDVPVAFDLR